MKFGKSRALREAPNTLSRLAKAHPDAHCELEHHNAFELIIATVLSAQSTDVAVNKLTPAFFARWPDPSSLSKAEPADVERALSSIGMYRQKTRNVLGLARMLLEKYEGEVPRTLAELVKLPGVGRKTANVVLGVAFGTPEGVVVDTHVQRLCQRLGWTKHADPENIERDLMKLFPKRDWDLLAHILIFHGRRICTARKPACAACPVNDACPSAFRAENIGRKAPRDRATAQRPGDNAALVVQLRTAKARTAKQASRAGSAKTKTIERASGRLKTSRKLAAPLKGARSKRIATRG